MKIRIQVKPVSKNVLQARPLKPACSLNGYQGKAVYLDETLPRVIIKTGSGAYEMDLTQVLEALEEQQD